MLLHQRGEVGADNLGKPLDQQAVHHHAQLGRAKPAFLLFHVAAILNGGQDGGVGRGPAHALLFQLAHQGRLRIARRRLGEVLLGLAAEQAQRLAFVDVGQAARGFVIRARFVLRLGVDREVAGKAHDLAIGAQADPASVDLDDGLVKDRGRHLAGLWASGGRRRQAVVSQGDGAGRGLTSEEATGLASGLWGGTRTAVGARWWPVPAGVRGRAQTHYLWTGTHVVVFGNRAACRGVATRCRNLSDAFPIIRPLSIGLVLLFASCLHTIFLDVVILIAFLGERGNGLAEAKVAGPRNTLRAPQLNDDRKDHYHRSPGPQPLAATTLRPTLQMFRGHAEHAIMAAGTSQSVGGGRGGGPGGQHLRRRPYPL